MLRPILFNTEMVDAIQAGRKTATRRVIRWNRADVIKAASVRGKLFEPLAEDEPLPEQLLRWYMDHIPPRPFAVGDVVWVRETWTFWPCVLCQEECECCEIYPEAPDQMETADGLTDGCFLYQADGDLPDGYKWRPSIHMPREAARIFLKVKGVYPAKLQESFLYRPSPVREFAGEGLKFSETCLHCQGVHYATPCEENNEINCIDLLLIKSKFERLWDSTVPKGRRDRKGWAANPWVWVIRFERCERPEGWPE